MLYTLDNGKTINIPDEDIKQLQTHHNISQNEAIYTWLVDEDYIEDETVEELTKRAKTNRITATIHQAKSTGEKVKKSRPKKENPEKMEIIKKLADFLPSFVENVTIINDSKIIEFTIGDNLYKLDLIQHRKPKK